MKKIVVISGAGISAESGISTFRDANGLWENHDIMEVASFNGWRKNQELVLDFYNQRRAQMQKCQPNAAHLELSDLEKDYEVQIITQNVDDLHERAGSTKVLHLHGELLKVRSTLDAKLVYPWSEDLTQKDKCEKGSQLRPHIVWFGEEVPLIEPALQLVQEADILLVIGTSLLVYPAAGLINYAYKASQKFIIDPNLPDGIPKDFEAIEDQASTGILKFKQSLYGQE